MTGYKSKKAAAQAKLEDDDDIQTYTRPWVGLTDEEAQWLYDNCRTPSNLIEMVEAKLKEKNNG
jgi:hypothetical protein